MIIIDDQGSPAKLSQLVYRHYLDAAFAQEILNVGTLRDEMSNAVIRDEGTPRYVDELQM